MNNFNLEPGDILVTVNDRNDPFSVIKRWAISSPYEHVFLYMGRVGLFPRNQRQILRIPMLFESYGRGCALRSLSERYGEEVVVLRLKSEYDRGRIPYVLEEAVQLASDPQSFYDYSVIVWHIIPKLIYQKLGINPPLRYQRDERMICSEAVYEVFHRAKLVDILLPYYTPPLPGDFVTDSVLLERVWAGRLSEELI